MSNTVRVIVEILIALGTAITAIVLWTTLVTARNQLQVFHLDQFGRDWRERIAPIRHVVDTYGDPIPLDYFDHAKRPEEASRVGDLGDFFDILGKKVSKGYIPEEDACTTIEAGYWAEWYWERYKPNITYIRGKRYPRLYQDFENFANVCKKYSTSQAPPNSN
jgi:hypothetical protein